MRTKLIAIILCIFFAPFGIHRFYMGDYVIGLIWLLLFLFISFPGYFFSAAIGAVFPLLFIVLPFFGLLFLIPYLDIIYILAMSDDKWNRRYNRGVATPKPYKPVKKNTADELEKLHAIKEKGIISEKEFQKRKEDLL